MLTYSTIESRLRFADVAKLAVARVEEAVNDVLPILHFASGVSAAWAGLVSWMPHSGNEARSSRPHWSENSTSAPGATACPTPSPASRTQIVRVLRLVSFMANTLSRCAGSFKNPHFEQHRGAIEERRDDRGVGVVRKLEWERGDPALDLGHQDDVAVASATELSTGVLKQDLPDASDCGVDVFAVPVDLLLGFNPENREIDRHEVLVSANNWLNRSA